MHLLFSVVGVSLRCTTPEKRHLARNFIKNNIRTISYVLIGAGNGIYCVTLRCCVVVRAQSPHRRTSVRLSFLSNHFFAGPLSALS